MSRLLRLLIPVALAIALLGPTSTPVAARLLEQGRVTDVSDGDTFDIRIAGKGVKRVRMIGVQAMELDDYVAKTGDCHGPEAFRRLRQLVGGKVVQLSAADPASVGLKDRIQRFVQVEVDGVMRDVGEILLEEGQALWFPHAEEHANNARYQRAVRRARAAGVGLWDRDYCGRGPQQSARVKMWVQWDADGNDADNVNGEWVKIKNLGPDELRLGRWMLRESALRTDHRPTSPLREYTFPRGTVVPPRRSIFVHVGRGRDSDKRFYWQQVEPVFENSEDDGRNDGDGAYLIDPDGDVRFDFMYPCLKVRCTDRNQDNLRVKRVVWNPPGTDRVSQERITIAVPRSTNVRAVRLEGYLLEKYPYSYAFGAGDVVRKGKPLTLIVGSGTDTVRRKYWGFDRTILKNTGDTAKIRTFDNIVLHCKDWGNASC